MENPVTLAQSFGAEVSAIAFEMDIHFLVGEYADPWTSAVFPPPIGKNCCQCTRSAEYL